MRTLLLLLALTIVAAPAAANRIPGPVPAEPVEVIDGDTVRVRAHIWLGQRVETRVRLAGVDAPELRARCPAEQALAEAARDLLAAIVASGPIMLMDVRPDMYGGRVVARLVAEDGVDAGERLLAAGLAAPYSGRGPRPGWCGES